MTDFSVLPVGTTVYVQGTYIEDYDGQETEETYVREGVIDKQHKRGTVVSSWDNEGSFESLFDGRGVCGNEKLCLNEPNISHIKDALIEEISTADWKAFSIAQLREIKYHLYTVRNP